MGLQLEDGYTKIANEILEQLARIKLNGTQYRILLVVLRYTYGYNRKQHELSQNFIAKAIGCDRKQVKTELKKLIAKRIIVVKKEATFSSGSVIGFNKYFEEWEGWEPEKEEVAKSTPESELHRREVNNPEGGNITRGGQIPPTPGGELHPSPGGQLPPQQIKLKEKLNKNNVVVARTRASSQQSMSIYDYWTHCGFGTVSGITAEKLDDMVQQYSEPWLRLAMEEANNQGAHNLAYVRAILERWRSSGGPDQPKNRGKPPDKQRGKGNNGKIESNLGKATQKAAAIDWEAERENGF